MFGTVKMLLDVLEHPWKYPQGYAIKDVIRQIVDEQVVDLRTNDIQAKIRALEAYLKIEYEHTPSKNSYMEKTNGK